jgi:hypothetical protein
MGPARFFPFECLSIPVSTVFVILRPQDPGVDISKGVACVTPLVRFFGSRRKCLAMLAWQIIACAETFLLSHFLILYY